MGTKLSNLGFKDVLFFLRFADPDPGYPHLWLTKTKSNENTIKWAEFVLKWHQYMSPLKVRVCHIAKISKDTNPISKYYQNKTFDNMTHPITGIYGSFNSIKKIERSHSEI